MHRTGRRREEEGSGEGDEALLCLPVLCGQIQLHHFIPGWSGIQQAVACLSAAPGSRVSEGNGASGRVLWLPVQNFPMCFIYFKFCDSLAILPFPGCLRGSGEERGVGLRLLLTWGRNEGQEMKGGQKKRCEGKEKEQRRQTGGETERRVGFTRREQKRGQAGEEESILRTCKRGGDGLAETGCRLGNGALATTGSKR